MTDTPGLLARADAERNAMERLTLACLAHLPTRVLFVLDLTAECGTSVARAPRCSRKDIGVNASEYFYGNLPCACSLFVLDSTPECRQHTSGSPNPCLCYAQGVTHFSLTWGQADQWRIRSELRQRFPGKPWVDVLSKADLLQPVFAAANAPGPAWAEGEPPPGGDGVLDRVRAAESSASMSAHDLSSQAAAESNEILPEGALPGNGRGAEGMHAQQEVAAAGTHTLSNPVVPAAAGLDPGPGLDATRKSSGARRGRGFSWESSGDTRGAADVARSLPGAVRVSAVTGAGLEGLQGAVLAMMAQASGDSDSSSVPGNPELAGLAA